MQPQYPQQPYAPQFPQQPQYGNPYATTSPHAPAIYGGPQYGQPVYAPPAAPPVPLPTGTLDDFYSQPSGGGGPAFKFMDANRQPQIGKSYAGIVARPITNADIRAQTDNNGRPQTYKDGRPKFVMVVPMQVQPTPEFPEGVAGWWVKGQARDELARAMAEAGAPVGPPEAGAAIRVTLMGVRPVPNMSPAYQYRVEYIRPNGAPTAPAAAMVVPATQPVQFQQPAPVTQPAYVPGIAGQPVPALNIGPTVTPPSVIPQAAQAAPAIPQGFDADQAALFAKLTGQPAPTAA